MDFILLSIVIFLDILFYIIFFDVILSWLSLFGVRFRPQFLRRIVDPIYILVRKYIPTTFGMFDLTPMIVILLIIFLTNIIIGFSPEVQIHLQQLQSR